MNTMLEYVVYRTTGLEYIFQLLLPKMSVEANVRRFLRHSLVCATRLWGTLVLEWVTIWESRLLYVFILLALIFCSEHDEYNKIRRSWYSCAVNCLSEGAKGSRSALADGSQGFHRPQMRRSFSCECTNRKINTFYHTL
jgi:hypothetical protein